MSDTLPATIVWFRQDLRLTDHAALSAAVERGRPIVPLFLRATDSPGDWGRGAASRAWLAQSLFELDQALRELGSMLLISEQPLIETVLTLRAACNADTILWNRRYEPEAIASDTDAKQSLIENGFEVRSFEGNVLVEPWRVRNKQGNPFRVFTPFHRTCAALPVAAALQRPEALPPFPELAPTAQLHPVGDDPGANRSGWRARVMSHWQPGEAGAARALTQFSDGALADYAQGRDHPDQAGTSRLSPHLHFGELSPRQIVDYVRNHTGDAPVAAPFIRQIYWREFATHLLYHFPHTDRHALVQRFDEFPWQFDEALLERWQHGRTGYPLVDAGMRELWQTGWMHNRVRMNVASFLVKHLLMAWQTGSEWFWDTLVDADLANNSLGWQWAAGSGADAAPYFRIFNPTLQGQKFDPAGDYIRRYVPELARLPSAHIHSPHTAPPDVLELAGVKPGETYPTPVVEHRQARQHALAALESIKKA